MHEASNAARRALRDGRLLVVSRDLQSYARSGRGRAGTLQAAPRSLGGGGSSSSAASMTTSTVVQGATGRLDPAKLHAATAAR